MDVFRGEQLQNLGQDLVHKFQRQRIADAKLAGSIGPARAAELRISCENLVGVPRELNFRNHLDEAFGSIGNDSANFLFRIVTAIGPRGVLGYIMPVAVTPPFEPVGLRTECSQPGQQRISVDPDAPAAVIRQVEMKFVKLVPCHFIEEPEYRFNGEKVPRNIEMNTPITETGIIDDFHAGNPLCGRQQAQRLPAVEQSRGIQGRKVNAPASHFQPVTLRTNLRSRRIDSAGNVPIACTLHESGAVRFKVTSRKGCLLRHRHQNHFADRSPAGSAEERKSDNGDCKNEFHNHILWIEPIPSTLPGQNLPGTKILLTWIMQVEFLPKNGCRPASADNQAILSPFSFSLSINSLGENPNFFLKHVLKYFGSLNPEA